jgi:hypothetical protein
MRYSFDVLDDAAPIWRDEAALLVDLARCRSSTLSALMSDLRDRAGSRSVVAEIEKRINDRRGRRREADRRAHERRLAEKARAVNR